MLYENLSWLRDHAERHRVPIISRKTEEFLRSFLSLHHISSLLEIWSAIGYSALFFEQEMKKYSTRNKIISREISYPHYYQALENTKASKHIKIFLGNFLSYELTSYIWAQDNYDLIFIDGRKSETLDYLNKLSSILQTTKYIIVDDAIKFKHKMRSCYSFLDKNDISYTIEKIDSDDGLLIIPVTQSLTQTLSSQYDLEES